MKGVSDSEAVKNALNVGDKMPSFKLSDANQKSVSSDDLLKEGNLVLVFYRGAWCPFCNLYLKNLQKNMEQIKVERRRFGGDLGRKSGQFFRCLQEKRTEFYRFKRSATRNGAEI